jgi:hypothetical protein
MQLAAIQACVFGAAALQQFGRDHPQAPRRGAQAFAPGFVVQLVGQGAVQLCKPRQRGLVQHLRRIALLAVRAPAAQETLHRGVELLAGRQLAAQLAQ